MRDIELYKNENLSFAERVKDLISRMTIDEKVSQLTYRSPAIPRLGIPSYNWWNEALHGVARAGVATMFPQAIGMAATFDEELLYRIASVISTEARAKYNEFQRMNDHGIYKGLTFWSPNINIFRDPRWGRGHETYGEDPYLTGRLGVAFIKGMQGTDSKYLKTAACAKHYAVHSGPENERHSFNAVVSEKDLRETYLPAFRDCVKSGGVESVMGAYNQTNGEPCCGSKTLLKKILRGEWQFQGHVVSDCWAIKDFHENHRVTRSARESAALALNNGCDLNCGNMYLNLLLAYNDGLVTESAIDLAVSRLLLTRMKLGIFDDPANVPYAGIAYEENDCEEHKIAALEAAKKSLVLLKNQDQLLPLDQNRIKSIAVIGPNADSRDALTGNYCGTASRYKTILNGIQDIVKNKARVYYAEGCHLFKDKVEGLAERGDRITEAISVAARSDIAIVCLGLDAGIEGEEGDTSNEYAGGDRKTLELPGLQLELLKAVHSTGTPIILVLLAGSAIAINWADDNIPAIIQAWYPGSEGGAAVASMIFGEYCPSGRLPVTFYRSAEELPDFSDYSMTGRTYRYIRTSPLYPFGYGLSYSSFEYSEIELEKNVIETGHSLQCLVKVTNIGIWEAEETTQLYLKDVEASIEAPRWQLAGIRKLVLRPDETKEITFELTARQMALIDSEGKPIQEPGLFEVYIGGSQPDERSEELTGITLRKAVFEVTGEVVKLEY